MRRRRAKAKKPKKVPVVVVPGEAFDRAGKKIEVGDVVLLPCVVHEVRQGDESNVMVRSEIPWDGKMMYNTFVLSGRQVDIRRKPGRTPRK